MNSDECRTKPQAEMPALDWGPDKMQRYLEDSPWQQAGIRAARPGDMQPIRIVIGTSDSMLANNRKFRDHLTSMKIPHTSIEQAVIGHQPLAVLQAMAPEGWGFHLIFQHLPYHKDS